MTETEPEPSTSRDAAFSELSRYAMPLCITLMIAISAVFYLKTAQDDVDRYPSCFIKDCSAH